MALVNISGVLAPASGNLLAKAENIAYSTKTVGSGFSASEEIDKSVKDAIDEIDEANATVFTDLDDRLTTMETALDNVVIDSDEDITGVSVLALSTKVSLLENKINSVFVLLTQEEYDALETIDDTKLYLIKETN